MPKSEYKDALDVREGMSPLARSFIPRAASPEREWAALDEHALQEAMERTDGGPWESDYAERVLATLARLSPSEGQK